ncbi:MAG: DMT family transporter [Bdellovibrionaceae bacterium]|nr:DMT family transporter [Bdellovibrionales bacterium]MCB9085066.1 DMT family transporter [Pseudobdellovibrionaceae bacterium]
MRIVLLIIATMIWGFGFVATRWTLNNYDPIWSNSLRFVFAGLFSLPVLLWKNELRPTLASGVCSLLLLGGLQLQTVGIRYTTLAKSGFFTTFYAIFTPLLIAFIFRQRFRLGYWGLLAVSIVGVALLCDLSWSGFNQGDGFILASALLFALHIIAIDRLAQDEHPVFFNLQQCLYVGVMGVPLALILSGVPDLSGLWQWESLLPPGALAGFLFLSLFSSIGAFTVQVYVQQQIPAHIVSLIFLTESVFGALFGYLFFSEELSLMGMGGALLILMSVALVPILTNYEKKRLSRVDHQSGAATESAGSS